jgi:hypothetical protein
MLWSGVVDMHWWMTRQVERQATRMHEVMERLNVDAAGLARANRGDTYAQARTRCLHCGASDKCLRWLDSEQAPKRAPDFCPNLSIFERFRKTTEPDRN